MLVMITKLLMMVMVMLATDNDNNNKDDDDHNYVMIMTLTGKMMVGIIAILPILKWSTAKTPES